MRLIDADALIKDWAFGMYDIDEGNILQVVVVRAIEDMPTIEPATNWTPCAEGLPRERETVLVSIADGFGNDIMLAWYNGKIWKDGYGHNLPVLAWQPLPEPYNPDHIREATKKVEPWTGEKKGE